MTLELEATAQQVLMEAGDAKGVIYRKGDRDIEVRGQAVALGANAIFNPWLLQRSGFKHPLLGQCLTEQASITLIADLDGVDNFQGSTSIPVTVTFIMMEITDAIVLRLLLRL